MKNDAWILSRQPIDGRRGDSFRQGCGGSNPQFSSVGIRKKLDVLDALLELVEGGDAPLEQRTAVLGRLDALCRAVKQPRADRMLQFSDRSGNRRLRGV